MTPEFVPGQLVRFISTIYRDWGLGIVLRHADVRDRSGRRRHPAGFWVVLTSRGEQKTLNRAFLEAVL